MKEQLVCATLALAFWHGSLGAQEAPAWRLPDIRPTTIDWAPCSTSLVDTEALTLGERLRCGTMSVPLDHHHPEAGIIDVALIRVAAAVPAQRKGAIFFNPGGPGINPSRMLPLLARYWDNAYADHPVHGTKRRLAEQFDLVAVVQRGLEGGTTFECVSNNPTVDYHDIIADPSPTNAGVMARYMRASAEACNANPLHAFINTEQTAYDMEAARKSLGEPKLNYLGFSYGGWLGSWYAAAFPANVGRMVLDSSMDWTADWDTNIQRSKEGMQTRFERLVAEPAANDRFRYRLGADVASVVDHIGRLGFAVRQGWNGNWRSPEGLLAAQALSDWFTATPDLTFEALLSRIGSYRFHPEDVVDAAIRVEAGRRAWRVFPMPYTPEPLHMNTHESVFSAMVCNDLPRTGDVDFHKARISSISERYPAANGAGLLFHCVHWEGATAMRPPLSRLGAAGNVLMVHAENDPVTPLYGATAAFNDTSVAHLLVADGIDAHGVFGFTDSACIEDAVGRYLLNGVLPNGRATHCEAVHAAHGGPGSGFNQPEQTARIRSALAGMSASFAR
jgi:pimeloyl-ACP methyl ester carboxylesterase